VTLGPLTTIPSRTSTTPRTDPRIAATSRALAWPVPVLVEEAHLDRLRRGREVSDDVLHQLPEFHVQEGWVASILPRQLAAISSALLRWPDRSRRA